MNLIPLLILSDVGTGNGDKEIGSMGLLEIGRMGEEANAVRTGARNIELGEWERG
jgi:hypothetical protein